MSPGECAVFAAEFVRALAQSESRDVEQAAFSAGIAVAALRRAERIPRLESRLANEVAEMLRDMTEEP